MRALCAVFLLSMTSCTYGLSDASGYATVTCLRMPWRTAAQNRARVRACTRLLERARLNPAQQAVVYNKRGMSFAVLGDYKRAISDLNQAIRLIPREASFYWNRGLVYERGLKDRDRAIADYQAAYRLKPDDSAMSAKLRSLGVKPSPAPRVIKSAKGDDTKRDRDFSKVRVPPKPEPAKKVPTSADDDALKRQRELLNIRP